MVEATLLHGAVPIHSGDSRRLLGSREFADDEGAKVPRPTVEVGMMRPEIRGIIEGSSHDSR